MSRSARMGFGVIPLTETPSTLFGADNRASITIGPQRYGHVWKITRITVSTTSVVNTQMRMHLNTESPTAFLDGSYSGNSDTNDTSITLQSLDKLIFVWTGGDIGASAQVGLYGTVETA